MSTEVDFNIYKIAKDETYHELDGKPAYNQRFHSVMKFHSPGLAPVKDTTGAFHIDTQGSPAYQERYINTFGFYEGRSAVHSISGWFHILADGKPLYTYRYAWCGNFQDGLCPVRDMNGYYYHIDKSGKRIYAEQYAYVGDFREGYAVVQNNKGFQTHIDASGKFLHHQWYQSLDVYHKGYARAKDGAGWFHIDREGNPIYPTRFNNVEPFYNGVAYGETLWGERCLIDERGDVIKKLSTSQRDPFHQASGELVSYWRLETLRTAAGSRLFDKLPASFEGMAPWKRLLLGMQEMGLVTQKEQMWHLTEKGSFFKTDHPYSLSNAITLWNNEHELSWKDLKYSLETGKSAFEKQYGKGWFDYLSLSREKVCKYHDSLSTYARRDYEAIGDIIDFTSHRSIVDIGGSSGTLLCSILNRFPHLKGELFDKPEVCETVAFPPALAKRCLIIPGNFFEKWPLIHSEAAILARILHDWPDDKAVEILKNIPCNTIYILEYLLNEHTGNGALLDLNMLVMTGGKERTLKEYENLLKQAGFSLLMTQPLNEVTFVLTAKREGSP